MYVVERVHGTVAPDIPNFNATAKRASKTIAYGAIQLSIAASNLALDGNIELQRRCGDHQWPP